MLRRLVCAFLGHNPALTLQALSELHLAPYMTVCCRCGITYQETPR